MEEIKMRRAGESLDFEIDNETHWQDVRERAAIVAMQAIISNPNSKITSKSLGIIPQNAVCFADFLVDELKMQLETTKTNSLSGDAWLEEKYVMCRDKGTEKQGSQILADSAKTCKDEQVTFTCIDKKVTMSVQELIDYYIDNECANTAEECNF